MRCALAAVLVLCVASAHGAFTPKTMRAVVATGRGYGESDYSKIKVVSDQAMPQPSRGQVLIRVAASSINPVDYKLYSSIAMSALTMFHPKVLGFDVAGTVEAVGEGCSRLKLGDDVWADLGKSSLTNPIQLGAWAEYAVADESQVGLKPAGLSFAEAASLPLVGLTDLQALRMAGAPWAGRQNLTVVVTSGAGGTGTPALQLAKAFGAARIVTSSSPKNFDLLKRLGATEAIDYHKGTIWDALAENSVDVVYDNYGAPGTADAAMKSLRPGGVFVFLPGKDGGNAKHPKAGVKEINYGLCDSSKHEDLDELKMLADAGKLKAVIGQSFKLKDIVNAFNMSLAGHAVGKIGIEVRSLRRERRVAATTCASSRCLTERWRAKSLADAVGVEHSQMELEGM
eukprot:CAMPEP_0204133260 /NCGR_PEP_ID=MMETSP0361-20130328/14994_1 /ASSEMBLY_ACC=CAM_ASM_000343 /TAXON_ID=268821 /ORGANISM="Scrippsiella Hangoei, Strain SHTV-5" /LENGTH=398 /DNA_ID=CAMNT_0051086285 /DNA_START=50 /DNA_END=1243 /DNA_ORIENTATION=-